MARIIVDFLGISLLCGLFFAVIGYFFPGLGSPSGAISTVVASMVAGQLYGMRTGDEVSSGFAWKVAFILTVVSLVVSALLFWGLSAVGGPIFPEEISLQVWAIAGLFIGLLCLLIIRFSFRFGVKQGAKAKAK